MKFLVSKAFLYLAVLAIAFFALNDNHIGRHISYYLVISFTIYIYWIAVKPIIENNILLEKAYTIIRENEIPLSIQRNRLIKKDIYGNEFDNEWQKEIKYFIKSTVYKTLSEKEKEVLDYEYSYERLLSYFGYINPHEKIFRFIDQIAKEKNIYFERDIHFFEGMTGEEYELLCKDILTKVGWQVDTTKKSGDQGVDLIAIKNDTRVVIQCKRYSNNIGNSAVQEIVSGRIIYKADYGAVVSNVQYTKSAIELANASNVKLLHHYHLSDEYFYR